MGVNTEMHDCEPAMTRPQHLNVSYSPFQLHLWADYQTLWAAGIKRRLPPPPFTQLFNKSTMDDTHTSNNESTDILIAPLFSSALLFIF